MKLNPKKCLFGTEEGKFLGHMIMKEGIRANPNKIESLLQLRSPRTIKEVQALNGKLTTMGRFLAKSAEKTLPFYKKKMKKVLDKKDFKWTEDAEMAFKRLKISVAELPALALPILREILTLY